MSDDKWTDRINPDTIAQAYQNLQLDKASPDYLEAEYEILMMGFATLRNAYDSLTSNMPSEMADKIQPPPNATYANQLDPYTSETIIRYVPTKEYFLAVMGAKFLAGEPPTNKLVDDMVIVLDIDKDQMIRFIITALILAPDDVQHQEMQITALWDNIAELVAICEVPYEEDAS
jgi:hypothetical protein